MHPFRPLFVEVDIERIRREERDRMGSLAHRIVVLEIMYGLR